MKYTLLVLSVLLASCGNESSKEVLVPGPAGVQGITGDSIPGASGVAGQNGSNGVNSLISILDANKAICPASQLSSGRYGFVIYSGIDSNSNGVLDSNEVLSTSIVCNGSSGLNSLISTASASIAQCANGGTDILTGLDSNADGILQSSEVTSSAVVCNGSQGNVGATGAQGPVSTFSPISPIEPCGSASSPYKEVLLCLEDGSVLSDFSDNMAGSNTRFAFLTAGSFVDTDDSGCNFNVSIDSHNDTTVSWNAGSNAYSTYAAGTVTCKAN